MVRSEYRCHPRPSRVATTSADERSTNSGEASVPSTRLRSTSFSVRAGVGRGCRRPGAGLRATVEGRPRHAQGAAGRRHADLPCQGSGPPSAAPPVFEAESQQPCNFSLDVQDRVGGGELLFQPLDLRLQPLHLRRQRIGLDRLAALLRLQAGKRSFSPRLAPVGQMLTVPTLSPKQTTHFAAVRALVRLLQNPKPILPGELASGRLRHHLRFRRRPLRKARRPWSLVATLLNSPAGSSEPPPSL